MGIEKYAEKLDVPDIKLAGLQIWIHSRQFPDTDDFWDGNWLNITAHCGADGASVWAALWGLDFEIWVRFAETRLVWKAGRANWNNLFGRRFS